jgi:hypothetical protein
MISHDNDNPSFDMPVATNENDVLNTGFELRYLKTNQIKNNSCFYFSKTLSLSNSSESLSLPNDLR